MNKIASDAQAAASGAAAALPLSGIRVIDLTRIYSGPYCTFLMAMAGAEVIKIEPPEGETLRKRNGRSGASLPFAMLNANKRLLTLNFKSKKGVEILTALLKTADVLVENFRPGVMDRLGFSKDRLKEINPRMIVAQTSGYGNDGPYRDYPAMDLTVQAVSGIMDSTGYPDGPPVKAGPALVDFAAGTHLYCSIVTALFARERTGQVLTTEVAMMEAIYPTLASNLALAVASPESYIARTGNRHGGMSLTPYNVYKASDGFVAIICNNDRHWTALGKALEARGLGDRSEIQSAGPARRAHGPARRRDQRRDVEVHAHAAVRAAEQDRRSLRAGAHAAGGAGRSAPALARHDPRHRSPRVRQAGRDELADPLWRRAAARLQVER